MSDTGSTFAAFKKDLVCGSFAGVFLCLSGHPLDSIKVRMQNSKTKMTLSGAIKSTLRNEGMVGFYKGMGPPLLTIPFINSIIFSSYEFCKRMIGVKSED